MGKVTKVVIYTRFCYSQTMTNLVPHRHQPDLFVADLASVPLKELAEHLEFPFFGLAPQPHHGIRRFEDARGNYIELLPGPFGLPTIFDQDILIYCMSVAMARDPQGPPGTGSGEDVGG